MAVCVELADRFDFCVEEFKADRVFGIRRVEIQNSSSNSELTGQLNSGDARKAAINQPLLKVFQVEFVANRNRASSGLNVGSRRRRLKQSGDCRNDQLRPFGSLKPPENS